jgi:hypothetical protein
MPQRPATRPRTIRARRVRQISPRDAPAPLKELSNYELLECRSRDLEAERAHGGLGTSQPPDAEKPLLLPKFSTSGPQASGAKTRLAGGSGKARTAYHYSPLV